jgi:hypothetical protein
MTEFFPGTSRWHIFRLAWTAAEEKMLVFWRMWNFLIAFCQNDQTILNIISVRTCRDNLSDQNEFKEE